MYDIGMQGIGNIRVVSLLVIDFFLGLFFVEVVEVFYFVYVQYIWVVRVDEDVNILGVGGQVILF